MSSTDPLSVASTLSTSAALRVSSSFFALAMGMGHLRPRASRTFSTMSSLPWSAVCARHRDRALVLPQLPLRGLLVAHTAGAEVGGDDLLVHVRRRRHAPAHGVHEGRFR